MEDFVRLSQRLLEGRIAVKLIGLKSHAKCYQAEGCICDFTKTEKMLSTFWPAAAFCSSKVLHA